MLHHIVCALIYLAATVAANQKSDICGSIVISKEEDLQLLRNCSLVVGHVELVHLDLTPSTTIVAAELEEITDYLLVHRVQGLYTLQHIFPRLKLIRGQELLFDKYSLVVYENRDLENLGLISLLRIQQGDVRIERNPMLCFVDTVNWVYLLGNSTLQHFSFDNKPAHQCPLCNETAADIDNEGYSVLKHCWNFEAYQDYTTIPIPVHCPEECGYFGCNEAKACCSHRCLTGCSDSPCELCGTYQQNETCVDSCDVKYFLLNKRECVLENVCRSSNLIPHARTCLEKCPEYYQQTNDTVGVVCSTLPCEGNLEIHSAKDLNSLKECEIINGSLTIEITMIKAKIIENLEIALKNIKEITGYLKVKASPQLVSLQFLRNLHTIRGDQLIDGEYSLYIIDNHHLEQIWNHNQNVAVIKGHVYFHLNPRLCYEKIVKLLPSLRAQQSISPKDASPNSNGERVVCGDSVRILNATVEDYNATAARIKVDPMSADDKEVLLGYVHYYKEAPVQNVTRYDGRHGCGHDNWLFDISPNRNVRHVISNLKPYTQYAYFVKTLTMTDYHTQLDAYSEIQYFQTLPSTPGQVAKIYYHSFSASEIMIHWWPPRSPNGIIATYIIYYDNVPVNTSSAKNYMANTSKKSSKDLCQCKMKDPFYSGPLPDDENFYSKEQMIYDEALPNIIYIQRTVPKHAKSNSTKSLNATTNATEAKIITNATNAANLAKATNGTSVTKATNVTNATDTTSATNKTNAANANNTKEIDALDKADEDLRKYRREQELKALALQDTGIKNFRIKKPLPRCPENRAAITAQYQLENSCKPIENHRGSDVPGHIHQYTLNKLDPEKTYNISVRACNEHQECGRELWILAKTISETLEEFYKRAQHGAEDQED